MTALARRNWKQAAFRGARKKCPACGEGALFHTYLAVVGRCGTCGEPLHHQRADDAPAYFTIFIVGHVVVPCMLLVEKVWQPALWTHFSIWVPLSIVLTFWLLPINKGATVGLQWALRMHGFANDAANDALPHETSP